MRLVDAVRELGGADLAAVGDGALGAHPGVAVARPDPHHDLGRLPAVVLLVHHRPVLLDTGGVCSLYP